MPSYSLDRIAVCLHGLNLEDHRTQAVGAASELGGQPGRLSVGNRSRFVSHHQYVLPDIRPSPVAEAGGLAVLIAPGDHDELLALLEEGTVGDEIPALRAGPDLAVVSGQIVELQLTYQCDLCLLPQKASVCHINSSR